LTVDFFILVQVKLTVTSTSLFGTWSITITDWGTRFWSSSLLHVALCVLFEFSDTWLYLCFLLSGSFWLLDMLYWFRASCIMACAYSYFLLSRSQSQLALGCIISHLVLSFDFGQLLGICNLPIRELPPRS
jgi:hypothetical protein